MKTATVRDLRNNFARVSRWLAAGEKVQLTKRGVAVGTIVPGTAPKNAKGAPRKKFDLQEHRRWKEKTYRGKKFKDSIVLVMREEKDW
jgi:antitoxin (DNA-binding transcriptional repressor) of toxin-antitoxin stability system